MNKLEEIIERNRIQFLKLNNHTSISDLCKVVALEFAKHILEEAAKNAEILPEPKHAPDLWQFAKVDKESITSVIKRYL
jgi:hypothetical protein